MSGKIRYFANELAFDLPDLAFTDKTVTLLEAPTTKDRTFTIVMQRFPMPSGKSLRAIVNDHLARARATLPSFSLLHDKERTMAGGPAFDVGLRWRGDRTVVYTRNAFFVVENQWMLIGTNTELAERELCDEAFDGIIASVQLRRE